MKILSYLIDHFLYQIFKIILSISWKLETFTDNLPIKIYLNKIENKIRFRLKIGYYLERLMPEAMKLLGSAKITKDENGKNEPHLKITEVVLVHCNIVNNDNLKPCIHLLQLNRLFNY